MCFVTSNTVLVAKGKDFDFDLSLSSISLIRN